MEAINIFPDSPDGFLRVWNTGLQMSSDLALL